MMRVQKDYYDPCKSSPGFLMENSGNLRAPGARPSEIDSRFRLISALYFTDVKLFWQIIFLLFLAGIVYLSLRPSPAISTVPFFPHPLAAWFDRHNFMANFLGFGVLAGVGLLAFAAQSTTELGANPPAKIRSAFVVAAVCGLVQFLEIIQFYLPKRFCDWRDTVAGCTGALAAWGIVYLKSRKPIKKLTR